MADEVMVTIIGNAVNEPELRFVPSGAAVAKFRIATTPRKFDRDQNKWVDDAPSFYTVVAWRQMAENVAESVTKGMRIVVHGSLKQRSYETREGEKRTDSEVEATDIGASVKFATAKVSKMSRSSGNNSAGSTPSGGGFDDPWATSGPGRTGNYDEEAPF